MTYKKGDRVAYTFYGVQETGTVTKDQASMVVFVQADNGRNRWMFEESLVKIPIATGAAKKQS
jgi:hypothetical protein